MPERNQGTIMELNDGKARITLSPDDLRAFTDWQRLDSKEKANLIKLARCAPSILIMVRVAEWLSGASYLILRAGALGAAVLAVLSVIRSVSGT